MVVNFISFLAQRQLQSGWGGAHNVHYAKPKMPFPAWYHTH